MLFRNCASWELGISVKFENTTGKYHVMHNGNYQSSHDEEWKANAEAERLADILWNEMMAIGKENQHEM